MKKSGEITVFLSMCLLCISALLCVMLESARTAGSRYYLQVAAGRALDTLFSRYHRRLWDEYRIFALEYGAEEEVVQNLENYINEYLSVDNWYPMKLDEVDVTCLTGIGDHGGEYLKEEVLDYMRYGAVGELFIEPEQGEQFIKDVTEAAGVHSLSGSYNRQERAARQLEESVEKLVMNVREQEEIGEEIANALGRNSKRAFFKAAGHYRSVSEQYPRLMRQYERNAEILAGMQRQCQTEFHKVQPDLQDNREELFRRQWDPYDDYIAQDGERRQELAGWEHTVESNRRLLDETEEMVRDSEEEEEDQELLSLEAAARYWQEWYTEIHMGVKGGAGDKEKQNLLDQVKRLAEGGLLEAVMPEGTAVSTGLLPAEGFPSKEKSGEKEKETKIDSISQRVITGEYCGSFFTNALSTEKHPVQYELEYLLKGSFKDRENLEETVTEIFAVREGLNLIHILSDAQKRQEAEALALVITGSTGMVPLVKIVACVVMGIWAAGESLQDLRILMSGGKVPLWKQKDDWNVNLEGVLNMGRGVMPDTGLSREKGFSYEEYVKLLLLKQNPQVKYMRMLDVMQMNIRREEPGFSLMKCAYRVDMQAEACGKHVFFTLPFVETFVNGREGYTLKVTGEKAY